MTEGLKCLLTKAVLDAEIDRLRKVIADARQVLVDATGAIAVLQTIRGDQTMPVVDEMKQIARQVASETGVTVEAMKGPERSQHVFLARAEAMRRIRLTGRYSLPQIGKFFGDRDHSTVMNALDRADYEFQRRSLKTLNRPALPAVTNSSCPVTMP